MARELASGEVVGPFRVEQRIGQGGMGVVYRAQDTRLGRSVALKLVTAQSGERWEREARALAALNHPHIATLYDVGEHEGSPYLAMEYVEGRTLDEVIGRKGLRLSEALKYAAQIAEALGKAHASGIVHRDLKPGNVMVTSDGQVKVLDFGLAKLTETAPASRDATTLTEEPATGSGVIVGTVSYMSPEQAEGKPADARTDIFSFGAVLYEMLTGCRPFRGDSKLSTLMAILHDPPAPLKEVGRKDISADVERVLMKCLEKDRESRYGSGEELRNAVAECRRKADLVAAAPRPLWKRPLLAVPAVLLVLVAIVAGAWSLWWYSRFRWARQEAIPEIRRLVKAEDFWSAYLLARRARRYIPDDPVVSQVMTGLVQVVSINTIPPGAEVYVKSYAAPEADWDLLGVTPLEEIPIKLTLLRWRVTREGFDEVEGGFDMTFTPEITLPLTPAGSGPPGMVLVPKGRRGSGAPQELGDFWIDRYEVTSRQYQEFVDAGGYRERKYWKHPFVKDGREIAWERAMKLFLDRTGRPGPSTWELGTYREGQGDYPVSGVSWHEAAAYAEFASKSLPTTHHWRKAAGLGLFSDILRFSNVAGQGPWEVGSSSGVGPYGTYDMAGNVREWCWNLTGERRHVLGGAWNEPDYIFAATDAQPPFTRLENCGFRCVRYVSPPEPALSAPVERTVPEVEKAALQPIDDEGFELIRGYYSYDRTGLNAKVETLDDSARHWRVETVSFDAAYGGERVTAYLFLPKNVEPPYQVVMNCPTGGSDIWRSSLHIRSRGGIGINEIVPTGRAVMFPIWKGAFERRLTSGSGIGVRRDLLIQQAKDLSRSIDYLETRKDIDPERIGYFGASETSHKWPIFGAIEKRIKVAVLWVGTAASPRFPELETITFAPRATAPALLINGELDFMIPVERARRLYRLLGPPGEHKRQIFFRGGHVPINRDDLVKEMLDWYDRYLGPAGK